jgi:serine/threonine protein kinase
VHRDLKSLNLLLDHKWNVKVADFGLTVFRDSVKRKGDGDRSVVGSVPWMAPELLQRDTDHRNPQAPIEFVQLVDVYSFGIILWEVLTRKRPYEGLSPSQVAVAVIRSDLRPTLPAGVLGLADHERQYLNLMSACWHRDPSVRPAFHRIMDTLVKINNAAGGNSSSSGFVFSSSSGSNSSGGGKADNGEAAGRARGPSDSMSLMSGPDLSSSRDSNGSYGNGDDGGSGGDGEGEERVPATKADRVPRRDVSFVVCDLARFDRVWQRNPAAADKAIRRFGGLVRHHAAGGGGHIHSRPSLHSGGTFMVAFAQPTAAVAFALALQSDVRREAELWRHARVGITHRPGPCGAPADDRTRTTYHPRDYADCLRLVARCPPGRVVCTGAFHSSFTEKTQSDATSDHHQQLRFTTRPDGSVRVAPDTTGDDEDRNEENDDEDEEECDGDEAVCSSDRCPWIIDAESIELGECIGEGSFAEVLEGTCDGRPVAVKRLFNSRLDDHGMRKLRKEAAILSGIDHPHVVKLMGLSVGHRSLLLVMELVPRGSLRTLLSNPSVGLKWPQRLAMLRDAALGLAFLHARGIVHRDIKSSNLLVDDDLRVKVADFGFATVKQDNCTMTRCGSPSWTAPEVLAPVFTSAAESGRNGDDDNGDDDDDDDDDDDKSADVVVVDERVYSEKADVYSFGIVMWEVLTRQVPYAEGNLTTVAFDVIQGKRPPLPSDCPPAYADTMRRCWHEKPSKRPDMDDVLAFFAGDFASV